MHWWIIRLDLTHSTDRLGVTNPPMYWTGVFVHSRDAATRFTTLAQCECEINAIYDWAAQCRFTITSLSIELVRDK